MCHRCMHIVFQIYIGRTRYLLDKKLDYIEHTVCAAEEQPHCDMHNSAQPIVNKLLFGMSQ